jgi:hypothetical protein
VIVVTLDMWPYGDRSRSYRLGRTFIWNKGGTRERGDYGVAVMQKGEDEPPNQGGRGCRSGEVLNYPRLSYNVWRLILRALRSAFPEEKADV